MFNLRNETKIGLLAIIALALGIWGFKFLQGINVLKSAQTFYVRYDNVEMLRPSSPVFLSGMQVGVIKTVEQDPENGKRILVALNVENGVKVPKDAFATIVGQSALGGKALQLDFETPCNGPDCATDGMELRGRSKNLLQSLIGDPESIDPYTERLKIGLTSIYDSIADPNDPQGFGRTLVGLQTSLTNLAIMTAKLNKILEMNSNSIAQTTQNAAALTADFRETTKTINSALQNLDAVSAQLKNAGLDKTAQKAGTALDSLTSSLTVVRAALAGTNETLKKVDMMAQKLSSGEGSAGKLLADPELYDNLVRDTRHLSLLMQDLRLNPKRYTTVKLKVFGKNKTPNYNSPVTDPAYWMLIDSLEREHSRKLKN